MAARAQRSPIHTAFTQLIEKHGSELFHEYLSAVTQRLSAIAELNRRLAELDAERDEAAYSATVDSLTAATREYYLYRGKMPEDFRHFYQMLSEEEPKNPDALDEISKILDVTLPRNSSLLPSLQTIRPQTYIMQVDAITNQLTELRGKDKLKVGTRGATPVRTTVTLDIPQHMRIDGGGVLTTYDKSILNGVTSLLESGSPVFSIPMLYHAMTGKQNPTVDEQLFEELSGKLEKMRRLTIAIDLSEENTAHFITDENGDPLPIENVVIEGYLLPLNKMSGIINGKKAELYQIIQNPPLYSYSKMRRQLASVPITLLNAPINNNSTTIPLKTYLLQRIEMMKNTKNTIHSNIILYETVYAELGDKDASKTRKMRIRNYANTILTYFVEQGYIKGYTEFKRERSVAGIQIEL